MIVGAARDPLFVVAMESLMDAKQGWIGAIEAVVIITTTVVASVAEVVVLWWGTDTGAVAV